MQYTVRWPDDSLSDCYSPSLVIHDFFAPGGRYAITEFIERMRTATAIANQRVEAKFGFACPRATRQLALFEEQVACFAATPGACVEVGGFRTLE